MAKQVAFLFMFVVGIVLLGYDSTSAQDVNYNYDQSVDFTKFKTYKWADVEGAMHPDQITDKNIRAAVDAELATKGLTKTDAEASDLLVGYELAINQEKQINTWGTAGWRWGGTTSATTTTINIGTLVLDIYDPATKQLVWRGTATKTLDPKADPEKRQKNLQKAMTKLLKNYPPQKKS